MIRDELRGWIPVNPWQARIEKYFWNNDGKIIGMK
jgi:hypothetical protein